jgi:hypothetical protein
VPCQPWLRDSREVPNPRGHNSCRTRKDPHLKPRGVARIGVRGATRRKNDKTPSRGIIQQSPRAVLSIDAQNSIFQWAAAATSQTARSSPPVHTRTAVAQYRRR